MKSKTEFMEDLKREFDDAEQERLDERYRLEALRNRAIVVGVFFLLSMASMVVIGALTALA